VKSVKIKMTTCCGGIDSVLTVLGLWLIHTKDLLNDAFLHIIQPDKLSYSMFTNISLMNPPRVNSEFNDKDTVTVITLFKHAYLVKG